MNAEITMVVAPTLVLIQEVHFVANAIKGTNYHRTKNIVKVCLLGNFHRTKFSKFSFKT